MIGRRKENDSGLPVWTQEDIEQTTPGARRRLQRLEEYIAGRLDRIERANHRFFAAMVILTLILLGTGYLGYRSNNNRVKDIANEAKDRRTENCKLFIRSYNQDQEEVASTKKYLASLTPAEKTNSLNRAVASNLDSQKERARVNLPPAYCGKQYARKAVNHHG